MTNDANAVPCCLAGNMGHDGDCDNGTQATNENAEKISRIKGRFRYELRDPALPQTTVDDMTALLDSHDALVNALKAVRTTAEDAIAWSTEDGMKSQYRDGQINVAKLILDDLKKNNYGSD